MHTAMEKIWNRPTSHMAPGNAVRSCQRVERLGEIELCSAAARAMEPKGTGTALWSCILCRKGIDFSKSPLGVLGPIRLTPVAELRAGTPRRPPAARWLPRLTSASEGAKRSQRAAMQLLFCMPANGPRVSSSAKLGRWGPLWIRRALPLPVSQTPPCGYVGCGGVLRHRLSRTVPLCALCMA